MQAGFWLAHHHPAVTPSPRAQDCADCGATAQLLANFCARCGRDLRQANALPPQTGLAEIWSQPADDPIECLLGNHGLLAAVRQTGWLDLWSPFQSARLQRLPVCSGVQAAALLDNLLIAVREDQVEVVHLTPPLRHDLCRFDRNAHFAGPGPLRSPLACSERQLAWLAGDQLVCYAVRPSGLELVWRQPCSSPGRALAWTVAGLWRLSEEMLCLHSAADGKLLHSSALPAPGLSMQAQPEEVWVCGRQGELWRWRDGQVQRSWPGHGDMCFDFAANAGHVVQCSGRRLHILSLHSGRQHLLEVPQPCVLPPLMGPDWAVLVSYEGMVYHLALDQEQPRVIQARRPFSSFEPIMVKPIQAGDKLFLAGPEGQLAGWRL